MSVINLLRPLLKDTKDSLRYHVIRTLTFWRPFSYSLKGPQPLQGFYPDALNRYSAEFLGRVELDIYIPL